MSFKRSINFLVLLFIAWFIFHTCYIIIDGLSDNKSNADVAVVLGNKVNPDGSLSERLSKRLDCAYNLFTNKRVKKIIVSGGLGKEGFYEGTKMKEYLVQKNIPDSCIIVDNYGNNTLATVKNSLALKDSLKFETLIVVSQYFHITRTKKLFRKNNFQNVSGVAPEYFELRDLYSVPREFFAFYLE